MKRVGRGNKNRNWRLDVHSWFRFSEMIAKSWFVLVILHTASTFDPCQTPNGEEGDCILLKECPSLYSHFEQGTVTPETSTLLKRSTCGFVGRQPKVCCPMKLPVETETRFASSNLLPDLDSCGLHTSEKIVGGEKTAIDEFPWMALLQFQLDDGTKSFECGGSLINKRYVLTAAHCAIPSLIGVRLGEYNTETNPDCVYNSFGKDCAPPAIDFGIEEKIVYRNYDSQNYYHDIALIRLDRDVEYSDFIQPICLPSSSDEIFKTYLGRNLIVSGWGVTENGSKSSVKLKTRVKVQDLSECARTYQKLKPALILDAGQMCAGGSKKRDSCHGDSGGPLMTVKTSKNRDPHVFLIGIVSLGPNPCARENFPAIYTKVAKYVSWIVGTIRP